MPLDKKKNKKKEKLISQILKEKSFYYVQFKTKKYPLHIINEKKKKEKEKEHPKTTNQILTIHRKLIQCIIHNSHPGRQGLVGPDVILRRIFN